MKGPLFWSKLPAPRFTCQISIKVHQRRAEEARELERLKEKAAGIRLLADEVKQELQAELEKKLALESQLAERRDKVRQAKLWLEGLARQGGGN